MYQVLVIALEITRDITSTIPKSVWAWEVPGYEEKFAGKCTVVGESVQEVANLRDVNEEAIRLQRMFGKEKDDAQSSYFDLAYGRRNSGIKNLEKLMKKSVLTKAAAKKIMAANAAPKPKPVIDIETDDTDEADDTDESDDTDDNDPLK